VPGIGFGTEPVARMTHFSAVISSSPTLTLPSPASDPWPSMTSILFLRNRPETPPTSVETTFWRRSATFPKSISRPSTAMPNSAASSISERMSADRRTAFAGMQA
jgi:hypothetical protein